MKAPKIETSSKTLLKYNQLLPRTGHVLKLITITVCLARTSNDSQPTSFRLLELWRHSTYDEPKQRGTPLPILWLRHGGTKQAMLYIYRHEKIIGRRQHDICKWRGMWKKQLAAWQSQGSSSWNSLYRRRRLDRPKNESCSSGFGRH